MKYRCPYCGEKGLPFTSRCGIWVTTRSALDSYSSAGFFICEECHKSPKLFFGKPNALVAGLLSFVFPAAVVIWTFVEWMQSDMSTEEMAISIIAGIPAFLVFVAVLHFFFAHFDKRRKKERDADARLTLSVSAERLPRVKKWGIYLLRFPKRGTNAASPVLYGMVCGKSGKKGNRTLEMRVIRADNMDLPDLNEPAWLVTNTNKVIEGTVTSVTPRKEE